MSKSKKKTKQLKMIGGLSIKFLDSIQGYAMDRICLWTDGSCNPNPGPGGWSWHNGAEVEQRGGELETTNNRMELRAILEALKSVPDGARVAVYSDSSYCVNGLTVWRPKWKAKDWLVDGEPRKNRDLFVEIEAHLQRCDVLVSWVRGHAGDPHNERADLLAEQGRLMALLVGEVDAVTK